MIKTKQLKLNTELIEDNKKAMYYCAFSYLFVPPIVKAKLYEYFDFDIKRAWDADKKDLETVCDFYNIPVPKGYFEKKAKLDIETCFKNAFLDEKVRIITYEDEKYPPLLRQIPDFPLALYYKGDLEDIDYGHNLAIVGSRKASNEAKLALNSIISQLRGSNITIISGLAYGIDAVAHTSALNNDIKTIGVIGSGLDTIYPAQNKKIYEDIINFGGAIFSEYPLKTQPLSQNFPQRNRIMVGMAFGTLVAEAQLKSGAMISANLTLDYNRELMCMPGNILNPNTSGIYHLIRNGAGIIVNSQDLLNQMDWAIILKEDKDYSDLNETHKKILESLSLEAKTFDEIAFETNEQTANLMVSLTELELKSLIIQSNNRYYKK